MKTWIIPDIHGCAKTLRALVEEQIRPTAGDTLYFLGDYIDRGPDPKGVLDFIMDLEHQDLEIRALRGNHEEYLLMAYDQELERRKGFHLFMRPNGFFNEWMRHGGRNTLKSFGKRSVLRIPVRYIEWLRGLSTYFETPEYVIVHAGLNFDRKDPLEDEHFMLWARSFEPQAEKIGNRTIIHGHVPVSLDFMKFCLDHPEKKYIPLDNGCYLPHREGMGHLVALELTSRELLLQRNVEK